MFAVQSRECPLGRRRRCRSNDLLSPPGSSRSNVVGSSQSRRFQVVGSRSWSQEASSRGRHSPKTWLPAHPSRCLDARCLVPEACSPDLCARRGRDGDEPESYSQEEMRGLIVLCLAEGNIVLCLVEGKNDSGMEYIGQGGNVWVNCNQSQLIALIQTTVRSRFSSLSLFTTKNVLTRASRLDMTHTLARLATPRHATARRWRRHARVWHPLSLPQLLYRSYQWPPI